MTIRATITLLTLPLFLLLALVDGALLYIQEKTEVALALHDQAEAAAVTVAAFASGMDRPGRTLAEPQRAQALATAVRRLPGVEALYLLGAGTPLALVPPARALDPSSYRRPGRTEVEPISGPPGDRHVVALAPAGPNRFVAVRIDAEPLMRQLAHTARKALAIVLAAGLVAMVLAWLVARRITGELQVSAAAIAAIGAGRHNGPAKDLSIREAKDLADAVHLMQSSNEAAEERDRLVQAHNDRTRTLDSAFAAWRQTVFAPTAATAAGRQVALRMTADAPLGAFFVLCERSDRAMAVIGRCDALAPGDALANALAARRFLEESLFAIPTEECLALAQTAYGIAALRTIAWDAGDPAPPTDALVFLSDAAHAQAITAYAARNPDASPEELLDAIAVLASPSGVFAAVGRC